VILIKNIYTLWGRKRFLLPVTYFPTNLVYPFTLRVTGINTTLSYVYLICCPGIVVATVAAIALGDADVVVADAADAAVLLAAAV